MYNGMLDIETMGNNTNAAITSIGLVVWDDKHTFEFYKEVSLESSVKAGAKMDVSTILWWMQQNDNARSIYEYNDEAGSLKDALIELTKFVKEVCNTTEDVVPLSLWGNGVAFDNVILRNSYELFDNVICPFAFWNDRCYRTLKNLYSHIKLERAGTHHHALDDAVSQKNHLELILKEMNK